MPITKKKKKGYPFEVSLPSSLKTYGIILTDQIKSLDWQARRVEFVERATEDIIEEVQARIEPLLF